MGNKIVQLERDLPHEVAELICIKCGFRYIGCYPERVLLKDLMCAECGKTGFIIKTGQTIEDDY